MNTSPVEAVDTLNGYGEIAAFLRITIRQAKHWAAIGAFPIFKQGRLVTARKSSIMAAFARAEAAARRPSAA